jgi:hypothetical protein
MEGRNVYSYMLFMKGTRYGYVISANRGGCPCKSFFGSLVLWFIVRDSVARLKVLPPLQVGVSPCFLTRLALTYWLYLSLNLNK